MGWINKNEMLYQAVKSFLTLILSLSFSSLSLSLSLSINKCQLIHNNTQPQFSTQLLFCFHKNELEQQ